MVAHAGNPSTQEAEAGGLRVPDQPELHSEILYPKKKKKNPTWGKQLEKVFRKLQQTKICLIEEKEDKNRS
jgi:hypothetical protein